MALRRAAVSASILGLCIASATLSLASVDEFLALPAPPEPAEVVFTQADLSAQRIALTEAPAASSVLPDIVTLLPPPPEPAEVVFDVSGPEAAAGHPLDIATLVPPLPEPAEVDLSDVRQASLGADTASTVAISLAGTITAAPVIAAQPVEEPPAPISTASLSPSLPVDPLASLPMALPEPPEAAPVRLDDVATAPAREGVTADALRPLIAAGLPDLVRQPWLPDSEQRAVLAFYQERDHAPLWHDGEALNAAGQMLRAQLARAAEDGLRPADYALPQLLLPRSVDLAAADVRLTLAAVRYARDARGGRIDPRRLSALITPRLELPATADVLSRLGAAGAEPAAVLASFQPHHAGYRALRTRLATLRAERPAPAPEVRIPAGPAVRIGMRDDRIVLVRARFGFAPGENRVHDRSLAAVIAEFQRENGLTANGVLNRVTVDALNGVSPAQAEGDLIAAMERWRWLPADLGEEHIIVNVPEYMMRKVEGGAVVHSSRVVVGKAERPTPIFSEMMDHLVLNPSWTIPPTILRKDILPKLASDPGYAERLGYQVIRRGNNITVRQPPGPSNALGNVKFMFPNNHAVYLHDTPSRNLFASARRAYSSGCVRVERPLKLAELVLSGTDGGWSERRLQNLVGSGERTIRLARKLPIHIVYMTHVVDENGALRTFEDIYGFHRRTRDALGV
jgi:murein L,D-transpeptidase YcbB/YkuD